MLIRNNQVVFFNIKKKVKLRIETIYFEKVVFNYLKGRNQHHVRVFFWKLLITPHTPKKMSQFFFSKFKFSLKERNKKTNQ